MMGDKKKTNIIFTIMIFRNNVCPLFLQLQKPFIREHANGKKITNNLSNNNSRVH